MTPFFSNEKSLKCEGGATLGDLFRCTYLPIHMLAWQESVEGSWADGPSVAPPADSTSAAWLVMSRYSWMNWYRFMMREASIMPFCLFIWEEVNRMLEQGRPSSKRSLRTTVTQKRFRSGSVCCIAIIPRVLHKVNSAFPLELNRRMPKSNMTVCNKFRSPSVTMKKPVHSQLPPPEMIGLRCSSFGTTS